MRCIPVVLTCKNKLTANCLRLRYLFLSGARPCGTNALPATPDAHAPSSSNSALVTCKAGAGWPSIRLRLGAGHVYAIALAPNPARLCLRPSNSAPSLPACPHLATRSGSRGTTVSAIGGKPHKASQSASQRDGITRRWLNVRPSMHLALVAVECLSRRLQQHPELYARECARATQSPPLR